MAISTDTVAIGTSATLIAEPGRNNADGISVFVSNPTGNGSIYVGGPDVTTADGIAVEAGASLSIDLPRGAALYGIASSPQTIRRLVVD